MKEIFKDIPGYKDYQASDLGRFKSLKFGRERILKQTKSGKYNTVSLTLNNNKRNYTVSQLIAITFLEHKPNGHKLIVDHIDNNQTNDRLDNLQLITARENLSKDKVSYSKYTGVFLNKGRGKKWVASISLNGKNNHLGYFNDEINASNAYQNKLKQIQNG